MPILALSLLTLLVAPPEPEPEPELAEPELAEPEPEVAEPESQPRTDPREVYEAVTRIVEPTALLETDYVQHSDPVEGHNGFALARARLGLRLHPTRWLTAVGTVEFVGADGPYLLDGYAQFEALDWIEVTVGYSKPPLFASFRHDSVTSLPMPGRSAVVNQMRVRRDVGAELRLIPKRAPIEAMVRLGNGSMTLANDNQTPTGYAAVDLVLGNAWAAHPEAPWGLRVGVAGMVDDAPEHDSIAAATPLGYVYTQPVRASGLRAIATAHAIAYVGPVRLVLEGAFAQEGRSDDADGDPATPAIELDPVRSWGLTGELTWTIRGGRRVAHRGPAVPSLLDGPWTGGALELSARADHFWLGRGADDLFKTGGTSPGLALKWWPTPFLALTAYGDATIFEEAPATAPDHRWGWTALIRATLFWG